MDGAQVRRLTDALRLRGPDAQDTWCEGQVGLGHALLRTTFEAVHDWQPFSLDGRVFIVADGRVDARGDLIRALGRDSGVAPGSPDVQLILCAYLKWGPHCVDHLIGDYAFVVWDGPRRRLFCARDHMGVKPLYYAHVGRWLLVSSTIEALRLHPDVSSELNELAIADFLMFGRNQDFSTTSFSDIHRLPPAHTLTWLDHRIAAREGRFGGALRIERYWTLPIDEPVYHRHDGDYVEEFKGVVRQAVEDRLRVPRVGVFMSGGLDSPMLAATAQGVLRDAPDPDPVHAFTFVYETLFADPEREAAKAVAHHLRIPIHQYALDEQLGWFPAQEAQLPEPSLALMDRGPERQCYQESAQHSPVAFYGEGPDNALGYEWRAHLTGLVRTRRFSRLAADIGKHVVRHKRVPLLTSVPGVFRSMLAQKQEPPEFPDWLEPGLVSRLNLRERWRTAGASSSETHPWRPKGYASLLSPHWQSLFERLEPAYTRASLEMRHPYVDIRVLRCMLRVPALPWCRSKHLLRTALRGVVPEPARTRAKTPLARDPLRERIRRLGPPEVRAGLGSRRYGNASRLKWTETAQSAYGAFQFVTLSHWLDRSGPVQCHQPQEEPEQHGFKTEART